MAATLPYVYMYVYLQDAVPAEKLMANFLNRCVGCVCVVCVCVCVCVCGGGGGGVCDGVGHCATYSKYSSTKIASYTV